MDVVDPTVRPIIEAQIALYTQVFAGDPPELSHLVDRALTPADVRRALLKELPVLAARRDLDLPDPSPRALREEAAAVGFLDATPHDMQYRRLYPTLDMGIYAASHAMGKPSVALVAAMEEHIGALPLYGIDAWFAGGWMDVVDAFRQNVAALVGGDLFRGDVVQYANFSEALSAILFGLEGKLVTTEGHFTTAHYIHRAWAERTGGELVVVPVDEAGCVETDRLIAALEPDTTIVSLSHAFWRNGYLLDIYAIAEAMMDVCPEAVLLLDAYQTLGTVPLSIGRLPLRTAVMGGGIKQLRAGSGAGFAWIGHPLLDMLDADRFGWWAHRDPLAFAPDFEPGLGGARFRTGTPALTPIVALNTELGVFATSGDGSLASAIARARVVTSVQVADALQAAELLGLDVRGPQTSDRRAAFGAIWVEDGRQRVDALNSEGVVVDFRPDEVGGDSGLIRLSANAASFGYELLYAVERIAAVSA